MRLSTCLGNCWVPNPFLDWCWFIPQEWSWIGSKLMRFYRTLLNQETCLWPLQIESKQKMFYVSWTVKDRTHGLALTHWGRVKHIRVSKLTTIGSDNGLSPGRRQAIIWSNAGILLNWTNFREILSEIDTFSFKQMRLKMSSGKWRPYCLGLNVLRSGFAMVATGWR